MSCRRMAWRLFLAGLVGFTGLPSNDGQAATIQVSDDRPPGKISPGARRLEMPLARAVAHLLDREAALGWTAEVPTGVLTADLERVPLVFLPLRRGERTRRWWLVQDARDPGVTWIWESPPGGRYRHVQPARQTPGRVQVRPGGG